ncbi:MAG: hypothetical protein JWR26_1089 [Pedosphaera sp.]|nr:hypothetical protein [Pedosphaera sp.]
MMVCGRSGRGPDSRKGSCAANKICGNAVARFWSGMSLSEQINHHVIFWRAHAHYNFRLMDVVLEAEIGGLPCGDKYSRLIKTENPSSVSGQEFPSQLLSHKSNGLHTAEM